MWSCRAGQCHFKFKSNICNSEHMSFLCPNEEKTAIPVLKIITKIEKKKFSEFQYSCHPCYEVECCFIFTYNFYRRL